MDAEKMDPGTVITGRLAFDAGQVRQVTNLARHRGECCQCTKARGIYLACGGARAYAVGAHPRRNRRWRDAIEILWPGEEGAVPVYQELVEPHLHPGAERLILQLVRCQDGFGGVIGVWCEPARDAGGKKA